MTSTPRFLLAWLLCCCPLWSTPYRFLIVISDEWKDPASCIIEGNSQFATVAALLKTWGLPFDILRLDQERLDNYYLLDREGQPRYGTIIWLANPDVLGGKELKQINTLVRDDGVNLVALGDAVRTAEIAGLAGVSQISEYALIETGKGEAQ